MDACDDRLISPGSSSETHPRDQSWGSRTVGSKNPNIILRDRPTFAELRRSVSGHAPLPISEASRTALKEWAARQNAMQSGSIPMRALQYDCSGNCDGLGLRLQGMVMAFWAAFLTNRAVLLHHSQPMQLFDIFDQNELNWEPRSSGHALECKNNEACLLSLMEALAKNKNDVIVANLAEHFGSLGALQSLVSPQRWAVAQDVRFSFQVALDMLFKPGRDLLEQLDVVLGDSDVMFSASPLVCIHARTGKADSASYHWLDAGRLVDRYVLEASRLRARIMCRDGGGAQAMDPSKPGRFMVASDAEEVVMGLAMAYVHLKHASPTVFPKSYFRHNTASVSKHFDKITPSTLHTLGEVMGVVAELVTLTFCDGIVTNGESAFSRVAAMWAEIPFDYITQVGVRQTAGGVSTCDGVLEKRAAIEPFMWPTRSHGPVLSASQAAKAEQARGGKPYAFLYANDPLPPGCCTASDQLAPDHEARNYGIDKSSPQGSGEGSEPRPMSVCGAPYSVLCAYPEAYQDATCPHV